MPTERVLSGFVWCYGACPPDEECCSCGHEMPDTCKHGVSWDDDCLKCEEDTLSNEVNRGDY